MLQLASVLEYFSVIQKVRFKSSVAAIFFISFCLHAMAVTNIGGGSGQIWRQKRLVGSRNSCLCKTVRAFMVVASARNSLLWLKLLKTYSRDVRDCDSSKQTAYYVIARQPFPRPHFGSHGAICETTEAQSTAQIHGEQCQNFQW